MTKKKKQPTLNVALIAIGRKENRYAREWVEYHLQLGVQHIYILDNNRQGEEHFEAVLQDYIDAGTVTVEDYRDKPLAILQAYTEAYNRHKDQHDWLGIIDFDEFLDIRQGDLNSFLADRASNCVLVNWECYGDNGRTKYTNAPLQKRFIEPLPHPLFVQYDTHAENEHVKSFIRGGLGEVRYTATPHVPAGCGTYETADRYRTTGTPLQPFSDKVAVLRHYITKTAEEWVEKVRRGGCDVPFAEWRARYIDRFFKYNAKTSAKEKILAQLFEKVVAIVHYNTPELTEAAILSLRKHGGEAYKVVVFDNSDKRPFKKKMKGVRVIDNTKGQVIDFDAELAKFPDREDSIGVWGKCVHGSTKHQLSVQKLWELLPGGFLLMDPDILLKQSVDFMFQFDQCAVGHVQESFKSGNPMGIARLVPILCYINVPACVNGGARYFDPERTWGLLPGGRQNRNNWYDTGAVLLEDIHSHRNGLRGIRIDIRPLMEHLQSGSWRNTDRKLQEAWLKKHEELWK
jgi:hypothetical protein